MTTIAQQLADQLNDQPNDWYDTIDQHDPTEWSSDDDDWGTDSGDWVTFADGSILELHPGHFGGDWQATQMTATDTQARVCRCSYDRKQPWVDVTTAYCRRCDQRLAQIARDHYRRIGIIQMPWLGNDRS